MTQRDSLWSRFGQWMQVVRPDDTVPELARLDSGMCGPETTQSTDSQGVVKGSPRATSWRKRDEVLDQLHRGYDQVLDLVQSIQDHLSLQNKRSDQVNDLLMDMSKGILDVPRATRQQTETLTCLASRLEVNNRQNRTIVEALGDLPESARVQAQALDTVATQVAASASVTETLSDRLQGLGQVVELLGSTLGEQVETLQEVRQAARRQELQVSDVLERHSRRFALLTGVVVVLALAATLATTIQLFS